MLTLLLADATDVTGSLTQAGAAIVVSVYVIQKLFALLERRSKGEKGSANRIESDLAAALNGVRVEVQSLNRTLSELRSDIGELWEGHNKAVVELARVEGRVNTAERDIQRLQAQPPTTIKGV